VVSAEQPDLLLFDRADQSRQLWYLVELMQVSRRPQDMLRLLREGCACRVDLEPGIWAAQGHPLKFFTCTDVSAPCLASREVYLIDQVVKLLHWCDHALEHSTSHAVTHQAVSVLHPKP
jgi:hypothetical protein